MFLNMCLHLGIGRPLVGKPRHVTSQILLPFCRQAMGVCQSDRASLKKKLREMKKHEEKEERGREKRWKESAARKEKNFKSAGVVIENTSALESHASGRSARTESLL